MNIDTNGFYLGDVARDTITGVKGIITGVHQYTTGCARVTLQQPVDKDGKVPDGFGADVLTLELVKAGPHHPIDTRKGGPRADPVRPSNPRRR